MPNLECMGSDTQLLQRETRLEVRLFDGFDDLVRIGCGVSQANLSLSVFAFFE